MKLEGFGHFFGHKLLRDVKNLNWYVFVTMTCPIFPLPFTHTYIWVQKKRVFNFQPSAHSVCVLITWMEKLPFHFCPRIYHLSIKSQYDNSVQCNKSLKSKKDEKTLYRSLHLTKKKVKLARSNCRPIFHISWERGKVKGFSWNFFGRIWEYAVRIIVKRFCL